MAVLVSMTAATLVTTQAPAMADFSWCPVNKLCFATDVNGNGTKWSYWVSALDGGVQMSSNQRSQVSSVWNRTSGEALLFDSLDCNYNRYNTNPVHFPYVYIAANTALNLNSLYYHTGQTWDNRARAFGHIENQPAEGLNVCKHKNG